MGARVALFGADLTGVSRRPHSRRALGAADRLTRRVETGRARLARYVVRARKARYRSRHAFAEAAGVGTRTVVRIERGQAGDYREATKARVESALGWADGSIDRILAGGRPRALADPMLRELLDLWPSLSRDARAILLRLARDAAGT